MICNKCNYPRKTTLRPTERRLGEAAASTTVHAGHYRSNLHYTLCGVTDAVAPNRMLSAGIVVCLPIT